MKFLVFALIEVNDSQVIIEFFEDLKRQLGSTLQASFSRLEEKDQLASVFYMPCPKDGTLTSMQTMGGQYQEVYLGTCKNGHRLEFVDLDALDEDP